MLSQFLQPGSVCTSHITPHTFLRHAYVLFRGFETLDKALSSVQLVQRYTLVHAQRQRRQCHGHRHTGPSQLGSWKDNMTLKPCLFILTISKPIPLRISVDAQFGTRRLGQLQYEQITRETSIVVCECEGEPSLGTMGCTEMGINRDFYERGLTDNYQYEQTNLESHCNPSTSPIVTVRCVVVESTVVPDPCARTRVQFNQMCQRESKEE